MKKFISFFVFLLISTFFVFQVEAGLNQLLKNKRFALSSTAFLGSTLIYTIKKMVENYPKCVVDNLKNSEEKNTNTNEDDSLLDFQTDLEKACLAQLFLLGPMIYDILR